MHLTNALTNALTHPPTMHDTPQPSLSCITYYSFAMTAWSILARKPPNVNLKEVHLNDVRPDLPSLDAPFVYLLNLVISSWKEKPKERPTFAELLRYFDKLDIVAARVWNAN